MHTFTSSRARVCMINVDCGIKLSYWCEFRLISLSLVMHTHTHTPTYTRCKCKWYVRTRHAELKYTRKTIT